MTHTGESIDPATIQLLKAMVESTSDAVIGKTPDGIVTSWNRGAERIYGYTAEEMVGQSFATLISPGSPDDLEMILSRLETGEQVERYTARRLRKDGREIDVSLTITPIVNDRGETVGAVTIARDITEYLQTAEAFRHRVEFEDLVGRISTEFIHLASNDIDDGIRDALAQIGEFANVDRAYVVQFSDDLQTMGNTHEWCAEGIERQGHRFQHVPLSALPALTEPILRGEVFYVRSVDTLPPEAETETAELQHQKIKSLVLVPMTTLDKKMGFIGFDSVHAERTWPDEVIRLLTFVGQIFVNALQRRRAALALREREIQYRRIFEATNEGLVITDIETGRVLEANPAMCRMHGYDYDEFIGMKRTNYIHPDYHHVLPDYLEAIAAGKEYRVRAVDVRKDGSLLHVEANGAPVLFEGRVAILAVIRDITRDVRAYELMEQQVEQRTRELSTLLNMSEDVTSTLHLSQVLDLITEHLKSVVDHVASSILVIEGESLLMIGHKNHETGGPPSEIRYPFAKIGDTWEQIRDSGGIIISDLRGDMSPEAMAFKEITGYDRPDGPNFIQSMILTPLVVKGEAIGLLSMSSREKNGFNRRSLVMANAIARGAAIAVENARLFERAQGMAAMEERQRLARELHDSVSQALYGIALGAQTARRLLDRDPALAVEPMDYVLALADGGLAEMRALIFELRPESLETEGLVAALTKQTTALSARYRIDVRYEPGDEPDVSLDVKETLYRIAQEAMHNTVKHARAQSIDVDLACSASAIDLNIRDDGQGFDTNDEFPGHLGLKSMHERAGMVGGSVEITSSPGSGTAIHATIPVT